MDIFQYAPIDLGYTVTFERESWKSARLVYREGDRSASCYIEWDGGMGDLLFVGDSRSLMVWDQPPKTPVGYETYCQLYDRVQNYNRDLLSDIADYEIGPCYSQADYDRSLRERGLAAE